MAGACTRDGPCVTTPIGQGVNWVTRTNPLEGLGPYIRAIAHALMRSGHGESASIRLAIGIVRAWSRGEHRVTPATRARATAALAHWEALKAANRARTHHLAAGDAMGVDLVSGQLDRSHVLALAQAVETWPEGPRRDAARRRIAASARALHLTPDGTTDLAVATPAPERAPERRALQAQGKAMPGGRYPVPDRTYLAKAIRAVGRARVKGKATPAARAQVRRFLIHRAKALGAAEMIPSGWKPDGTLSVGARMAGR